MKFLLSFLTLFSAFVVGSVSVGAATAFDMTYVGTTTEPTEYISTDYTELYTSGTYVNVWLTDVDASANELTMVVNVGRPGGYGGQQNIQLTLYVDSTEYNTEAVAQLPSSTENIYYEVTITGIEAGTEYLYEISVYLDGDTNPTYPNFTGVSYEIVSPSLVGTMFESLTAIVTGALGVVVALFADDGVVSIFYNDGLTILGSLLLLTFGLVMTKWAFGYVRRLISFRG